MSINKSIVNELKKQYGSDIFSAHIGKKDYVFRSLTYGEYKDFTNLGLSAGELEEIICYAAVVYPEDIDLDIMLPGNVSSLSDEILEYSCFSSIEKTEKKLNESRMASMHGIEMMKAFILAAMPVYTYDQLDDYTIQKLTNLLAISELILEIKSGVARGAELKLSLVDPDKEEAKPKPTHNFSLEDLDKANRNPDSATRIGTAKKDDPIAAKLRQALG